jgi:hypothetical protein
MKSRRRIATLHQRVLELRTFFVSDYFGQRPNTEVCQYFWRKSSRILLCPAASLVISALPMKGEPFAEPNPDQDLAAASDAPGIPGIC